MKDQTINIVTYRKMSKLLKVVSDATRLKILFALVDQRECTCACVELACCSKCRTQSCFIEKCVGDIAKTVGISQSLCSHQIRVLKDVDILKARRDGNRIYYSLKDGHIKELLNTVKEHVEE